MSIFTISAACLALTLMAGKMLLNFIHLFCSAILSDSCMPTYAVASVRYSDPKLCSNCGKAASSTFTAAM
jgi:hypothetical protein